MLSSDPNNTTDKTRILLIDVLLVLLTFAIFFPCLSQWYFADDFHWLTMGKKAGDDPSIILTHTFFNYFRPVVTMSFYLEEMVYSISATGHHLTNLILHCLNVLMIFHILWAALRCWKSSLAGTLIFALAPAGCEAVIWVTGRSDLLATTFFLCALYLAGRTRFTTQTRQWDSLVIAMAVILAIFTKEATIVWPFALYILDSIYSKNDGLSRFQQILKWLKFRKVPLIAVGLSALVQLAVLNHSAAFLKEFGKPLIGIGWIENILGGTAFILTNPFKFVFGLDQSGIVVYLILILTSLIGSRKIHANYLKGILLATVLMIPAAIVPFPFLPEPHLTFRRFFYLPMLGAAVFWGIHFSLVFKSNKRLYQVGTIILITLMTVFSLSGTRKHVQNWADLTAIRRDAMVRTDVALKQFDPNQSIMIVLKQPNVWPEMFHLFAGRTVTVINDFPKQPLENNLVFVFDRGELKGPIK